ncbi:proline--tRNA ligase [Candidatus Gottesmanbacteria bacterium RIFCSPLOWO2_01_FULL_39_12b]|uniref:Proline--tRNA ligase n=1 Tax=Candidatus Gottesmanbacteria bacterium RIFCSPLOWO2_01_FULL_39_12b TaxID=1798388 RepID=A0A1F6AQR1_9BACT|nr:MAG: proline--tRNA ligase [Candidatus Gottesmanbacteria bacterium RIFCSPLOWO2_01_FULL_39_12b]
MTGFQKKQIVKKSVDSDRWYTDVILKSEMADYSPVKGCMIIRPNGYAVWEIIQNYLDKKFKEIGVQNAYFPLFIPNSFLKKEKEHVEGFSPQMAVVTIAGGEKLAEPLVVRPTSETIMYDSYSRWIESWRDLPLLLNIWNNVVRWEKRTYLFLRTTEFLWQEGHTAHATFEDADNFARKILEIYRVFDEELLAIPVVIGRKSQSEKFPGAAITYSLESLMPDGKVIQMGTSHHLGDNFARAFNIQYLDKKGERQYVWQTSWAETTRVIGALIMAHGDDQGLVLPPRIAPVQVIIIPISQNSAIARFCDQLKTELEEVGIRVKIDDREEKTVGWKFNEWELKGVPVRIEVGEKEIKSGELTVFRRDKNEKLNIKNENRHLPDKIIKLLDEIQKEMFLKQKKFTEENTHTVNSYEEFKKIMSTTRGFIKAMWCEDALCEKKIKDETKASTRVLPLETKDEKGKCIYCGKQAIHRWLFAQAY